MLDLSHKFMFKKSLAQRSIFFLCSHFSIPGAILPISRVRHPIFIHHFGRALNMICMYKAQIKRKRKNMSTSN